MTDGGLLGFGLITNPLLAYGLLFASVLLLPISAEMWLFVGLFVAVAVLSSLGSVGLGVGAFFSGWGILLQSIGAIFAIEIVFGLLGLAFSLLTIALPVIAILLIMGFGSKFIEKTGLEVSATSIIIFLLLLLILL